MFGPHGCFKAGKVLSIFGVGHKRGGGSGVKPLTEGLLGWRRYPSVSSFGRSTAPSAAFAENGADLILNYPPSIHAATCRATSLAAWLSAGPTNSALGWIPGTTLSKRFDCTVPSGKVRSASKRTTTEVLRAS